jgi:hypothetical protein
MKTYIFTSYSSMFKLALALLLLTVITLSFSYAGDESTMTEKKNTMVSMAGEIFKIPKHYLSPSNELPDKIEKENMIEVSFFFPNFSGFDGKDNTSTVGPYNQNQVTAFWTKVDGGGRLDANKSLSNAIKYGLSERDDSLDVEGLTAYKNASKSGVTYQAKNNHGDNVLIHCTDGPVNSVCKLEYLDRKNDRGIFASFDKKYLPRWLEVNNKILSLIDQWKT